MSKLSLSNCQSLSFGSTTPKSLWKVYNATLDGEQILARTGQHTLIAEDSSDTEWMISTGGVETESPISHHFSVWWINTSTLEYSSTAAWNSMDLSHVPANQECGRFYFPENDPFHRDDLWLSAIPCVPFARLGHLSAFVNDFLYIWQDDEQSDSHVYRILWEDVLQKNVSGWHRILPRRRLPDGVGRLRGGLWWEDEETLLPQLIAVSSSTPMTVFSYSFVEDAWSEFYVFDTEENQMHQISDNTADGITLTRNHLVVRRRVTNLDIGSEHAILDMKTKQIYEWVVTTSSSQSDGVRLALRDILCSKNCALVAFEDAVSATPACSGENNNPLLSPAEECVTPPANIVLIQWGLGESNRTVFDILQTRYQQDYPSNEHSKNTHRKTHNLKMIFSDADPHFYDDDTRDFEVVWSDSVVLSRRTGYIYGFADQHSNTEVQQRALWRINVGGEPRLKHGSPVCRLAFGLDQSDDAVTDDDNRLYYNNIESDNESLNTTSDDTFDARPKTVYYEDSYDNDDDEDGAQLFNAYKMVVFVVFQLGVVFLLLSQRPRRRRDGGGGQERTGIPPEQLLELPSRRLSATCELVQQQHTSDESNMPVCSICLLSFSSEQWVRELSCSHVFHRECLDGWLATDTTCPLCRVSCIPGYVEPAAEGSFYEDDDDEFAQQIQLDFGWLFSWRRDRETVPTNDTDGIEMETMVATTTSSSENEPC